MNLVHARVATLRLPLAAAIAILGLAGCGHRESPEKKPAPNAARSTSAEKVDATKTVLPEKNAAASGTSVRDVDKNANEAKKVTAEPAKQPSLTESATPAANTEMRHAVEPAQATSQIKESASIKADAPARETSRPATPEAEKPAVEALEKLGARVERNADGLVCRVEAVGLKVSAAELKHLADFSALEALEINETPLDDAALKPISALTGLRRLYLRDAGLTDAALENLKGLSQLEVLSLPGNRITGPGLAHLRGLADLEVLIWPGTPWSMPV
jgi:hypothetical protein